MTKTCSSCKEPKDVGEYHRKVGRADGRQTVCKACKQKYNEQYYRVNAARHQSMRAEHRAALQARNQRIIVQAKQQDCMDCGGKFPYEAMDFDHVRGTKVAGVAGMRTMGLARLLLEIAKCDVVCVNCHRRRTAQRRKSSKTIAGDP